MKFHVLFLVLFAAVVASSAAFKLKWASVTTRPSRCHRTDVKLRIKCVKGSWPRKPTNSQLTKFCRYLKEGIEHYWSQGDVKVRVVFTSKKPYKRVVMKYYKKKGWLDRSHNSDILSMVMKYVKSSSSPSSFKRTAAHEIGHSFLSASRGRTFSWTHKGTSTMLGKLKNKQLTPSSGIIDLMKYYKRRSVSGYYRRSKPVSSDVINMIRGAAHKTTLGHC